MQTNLMEYLDYIVNQSAKKIAFTDGETALTFAETRKMARAAASFMSARGLYKQPVVIFMKRGPHAVAAFFAALYAGNFYVPLDQEMPQHRIELILRELKPKIIICDQTTSAAASALAEKSEICLFDHISKGDIDDKSLLDIRGKAIDTDPAYIVFTSGSTGIPKGVIANHRSVIRYVETLSEILQLGPNSIFGNQTPLYFDACLKEIYPTLKFGATTYIIPKQLFMFPLKLVEYLNQYRINTICWVVSALTMISGLNVLESKIPETLRTIAFASEIFPVRQFRRWQAALPEARFINLYGPTEATGVCCYYEVDRAFELDEVIPIGKPFDNTDIILLNQHDQLTEEDQPGEICIRGTALTMGYYRDFERTEAVFVQNPLNSAYPELIYRTGDIGRYNDRGELVFVSRKDNQIKHMGHRIELGEIEVIAAMHSQIEHVGCVYDQDRQKITLFYVGQADSAEVSKYLKSKLPRYMIPNAVSQLQRMPLTANQKIDRLALKEYLKKPKIAKGALKNG